MSSLLNHHVYQQREPSSIIDTSEKPELSGSGSTKAQWNAIDTGTGVSSSSDYKHVIVGEISWFDLKLFLSLDAQVR